MELDAKQQEAVELMCTSAFGLVTGGPGTGKTTCLKEAVTRMNATRQRYWLCAPTGKASLRMKEATGANATTIHRLLWRDAEKIPNLDVIICDEASMVDLEIMGLLAEALAKCASPPRLILMGDPNQLPPVGPGKPFEDAVLSRQCEEVCLQTVHRQAQDSWVYRAAPQILVGVVPEIHSQPDFEFVERSSSADILAFISNLYANQGYSDMELQVIAPMRKEGKGASTTEINKLVQSMHHQGKGKMQVATNRWRKLFAPGDKVIHTKNDYDLGVVNGQQGIVMEVRGDHDIAVQLDDGRQVTYDKGSLDDLDLSYGITIHKSQGSEWRDLVVVMDPAHRFMHQRRLLYTAVTRASRGGKLWIVGSRESFAFAVKAHRPDDRVTLLQERLRDEYHGTTEVPR